MPWIDLPASIPAMLVQKQQIRLPIVKNRTDVKNMDRRPKISASAPIGGWNTAAVRTGEHQSMDGATASTQNQSE
ncbi:hypothetical protein LTR28_005891 [Elasticomyces elasticus]|nr:hypothetical protein LTR28_005891 [Elasticomyces elasticus]